MLPPDNFQEDPNPVVAHRTSPTNLGLLLLSTTAARDFGWIGTLETVERLEATLGDHGIPEALPRPLLQLVRHVRSAPARARLYLLGRQRQSGRPPDRARQRLRGVAGQSRRCARHRRRRGRQPGARPRGAAGFARRSAHPSRHAARARPRPGRPCGGAAAIAGSTGRAGAARREGRRPRPRPRHASGATMRAPTCCTGSRPSQRSLDSRRRDIAQDAQAIAALERRLQTIESTARTMANAMEFDFLFDRDRRLLSIGYVVAEDGLDPSCYDLVASEARLASFMAIANGDIPARHWFRLGREVTPIGRGAALISWSGSMFEYLMPSLVMRAPLGSLIERTNELVVRRQIELRRGPWRAVGHLRIGLQCARQGTDLPVFEFRRAGSRVQARLEREPRRRALCDGARRHGRSRGGGHQLQPARRDRRARAATASTRRSISPRRACRKASPWRSCAPTWPTTRA